MQLYSTLIDSWGHPGKGHMPLNPHNNFASLLDCHMRIDGHFHRCVFVTRHCLQQTFLKNAHILEALVKRDLCSSYRGYTLLVPTNSKQCNNRNKNITQHLAYIYIDIPDAPCIKYLLTFTINLGQM